MDWSAYRHLFDFAGQALDGLGGFRAQLSGGATHLVRHLAEGDAKFDRRLKLAVYENHMRSACDRFTGFLGRRKPRRDGTDAPLVQLMLGDADLCGNDLDTFWRAFAQQAAARGSMLLVIDRKPADATATLADQMRLRALPYVRMAYPEALESYRLDDTGSAFERVTLAGWEWIDDELQETRRDYDTAGWRLRVRSRSVAHSAQADQWDTLAEGAHGFGACPVLSFTEDGSPFPCLGRFLQIADMSRDLFNLRSELREILRAQTFSVLAIQVQDPFTFDAAGTAAAIGTHSALSYTGERPAYISPDNGPVQAYLDNIASVRQEIARVAMDDTVRSGDQAESGMARRIRFEAMNAALNRFSLNLQALEMRMWTLFHRALGTDNRVTVEWPTDYTLADVAAELDILALMQATGFPDAAQRAKRAAVAAVEWDNSPDVLSDVLRAIDEQAQEAPSGAPSDNSGADA